MKTAADILEIKASYFNYISSEAMVSEALNLLSSLNRTFLIVMENGEFVGVFSEHEFIRNIAIPGWDASTCPVRDVMRQWLPAISMETSIQELATLFEKHHTRYVPVFDGHQFKGVVTVYDILPILLQSMPDYEMLQN